MSGCRGCSGGIAPHYSGFGRGPHCPYLPAAAPVRVVRLSDHGLRVSMSHFLHRGRLESTGHGASSSRAHRALVRFELAPSARSAGMPCEAWLVLNVREQHAVV